jgi:hypothetical protein
LTQAKKISANAEISFQGPVKVGTFELSEEEAIALLNQPNPHGKPNSDVMQPWMNGMDITSRPKNYWIINFGMASEAEASLYAAPFNRVQTIVKPERDKNSDRQRREFWWRLGRSGADWFAANAKTTRYFALCQTAKHTMFVWVNNIVVPAQTVIAFARDDDYFFGVLHSRAHEVWALALGTRLEDRPRYTPTSCFETFPFPEPDDAARERISEAAKALDTLRARWLNPPEWMREETLEFPARADGIWSRFVVSESVQDGIGTAQYKRLVPRDGEMTVYDARPNADGVLETRAMKLKDALPRRTLTNLYNERPAWLENAHRELDNAVFAAYGWDESTPGDEEILSQLLTLNQSR